MKNDDAVPGSVESAHQWNRAMLGVKALLGCTDGELECIGEKLLDTYIAEVNAVYAAMTGYAAPAPAVVQAEVSELTADDVEWIVNDNAELGVKIGNKFFFLYKGGSLVYEEGTHDNGEPMMWRPVFKREFGECAHPINHADYSKIGTVSLGDSEDWMPLPPAPKEPA